MPSGYAVFRCPNCGHYTFAPLSQKKRLCACCGRIVKVDVAHAEIVKDARSASELVRARNVEAAPPKLKAELQKWLVKDEDRPVREGIRSSTLLMRMLFESCSDREVSLDELKEICAKYGLDGEWVEGKLPELALKGVVFFPSPWTVKCALKRSVDAKVKEGGVSGLSKAVMEVFSTPTPRLKAIKHLVERGYPPEKVEEVIEKLHRGGFLVEEKPGVFKSAK